MTSIALGFVRHFDGCEFETPSIQCIAYWRACAERVREAGFTHSGQRCAEHAEKFAKEQRNVCATRQP